MCWFFLTFASPSETSTNKKLVVTTTNNINVAHLKVNIVICKYFLKIIEVLSLIPNHITSILTSKSSVVLVVAVLITISGWWLGHIGKIVESKENSSSYKGSKASNGKKGGVHNQEAWGKVGKNQPCNKDC